MQSPRNTRLNETGMVISVQGTEAQCACEEYWKALEMKGALETACKGFLNACERSEVHMSTERNHKF